MAEPNFRQHKITVCTDCRFTGGPCVPGAELIKRLNLSIAALGAPLDRDFSIAGTVCMAACTRPCTIAFQATGKATYLFGESRRKRTSTISCALPQPMPSVAMA